jgi:hypothetical protein
MASIALGVACSHSPLLALEPEEWPLRAEDDRRNPHLPFRGLNYSFGELQQLRRPERLDREIGLETMQSRHDRNQAALALLKRRIIDARLDVLLVFGDDQREMLLGDNSPAFLVYTGEGVPFSPTTPARRARMSPALRRADWARTPKQKMTLKGDARLARHIVGEVVREGFDVAVSDRIAPRAGAEEGVGHAFGFYYHRLLDDLEAVPGLATVPVFINTFYPPNQPSAARVLEFGRAVGRAVRTWPLPARVGIAASGGMSHFVIDEELDARLLGAIARGDAGTLIAEPESSYQSGTSEIKNWIAAMGALEASGLAFDLVDYVPCYRSLAGTGNAMAFALWR